MYSKTISWRNDQWLSDLDRIDLIPNCPSLLPKVRLQSWADRAEISTFCYPKLISFLWAFCSRRKQLDLIGCFLWCHSLLWCITSKMSVTRPRGQYKGRPDTDIASHVIEWHNRSRSVTICWLLSNLWLSSPNKSYWQIFGYLFPLLNSSHTIYLECSAGDSKKCTISRTISPVYINKDGAKYLTVVTSFGLLVAGVKVQSVITVNCETVSLTQHWILILISRVKIAPVAGDQPSAAAQ